MSGRKLLDPTTWLQLFLATALDGGGWSSSCSGLFNPVERRVITRDKGGCVGPRADLDNSERKYILKFSVIELRFHGHPAGSLSVVASGSSALDFGRFLIFIFWFLLII